MLIKTISFSSRKSKDGKNSGSKWRETMKHRPANGISELSFTRCAEGKVKGVQANLSALDTPTSRDDEVDRTR